MTAHLIPIQATGLDAYTALTLPVAGQVFCAVDRRHLLGPGSTKGLTVISAIDEHVASHHGASGYSNNSLPLDLRDGWRCVVCKEEILPSGLTNGLQLQETTSRHHGRVHTSAGLRAAPPALRAEAALDLRALQNRFCNRRSR